VIDIEPRLVVVGIDVAHAALHEQEDDALRLGSEVRGLRGEWVRRATPGLTAGARLRGEPGERKRAEPAPGSGEPLPSGDWRLGRHSVSREFRGSGGQVVNLQSSICNLQSTYRKSADANRAWNRAAHESRGVRDLSARNFAATARSPAVGSRPRVRR